MSARTKPQALPARPAWSAKWLVCLVPALLSGAVLVMHARPAPSSKSAQTTSASGTSNGVLVAPVLPDFAARPLTSSLMAAGTERSYVMRYATSVVAGNGIKVASFTLAGQLALVGLASPDQRVLGVEFHGTVQNSAAADPGDAGERALEEAVAGPFLLEFANDGRFRQARAFGKLPSFVGRLWQALGEYLEVVRMSGKSWQVVETDASGDYLADYVQRGDALFKKKLRYESLAARSLKSFEVREFESRFRFEGPSLATLSLKEGLTATAAEGPFATFDSSTELTLEATGPVHASSDAEWTNLVTTAEPVDARGTQDAAAAYEKARIGGLSFAEAYARLGDLNSNDKDRRHRAERAFVALTALLRQDPKNLALVGAKLTKDGPLTEPLLAALRDASTPESQALLAKMAAAASPLSAENRLEAARSLSRVPTPTADTVEALKSLRGDATVGVQATYGLGSALHRLQDQDPELAESTRETLATQLNDAKTPAEQAAVLTALGNAGSAGLLEAIKSHAADPSPVVRAAAAQALRRIPGADADALLATLSRDPVTDVRWNAVDAIRERSPSPVLVAALSERALTELEFAVRARAINALGAWLPLDTTITGTLRVVAERDPSQDLRTVAKNALAKPG